MSTATEISRLTNARNKIRDKLIELGLANSTSKLDFLADSVESIVNQGAVSATVQEGDTYTIPAGYHNGSGTVSGVSGGGNYSLQSKNVTPTKSQQSLTPDSGYYGLSDVTVAAIPEAYQNVSAVTATAADVLSGKIIVDTSGENIAGTMVNNGTVNKILDATSENQLYTIPRGYHSGTGKVEIKLESKSATPSKTSQAVVPTTGKVLGTVTVAPIPEIYGDVTNDDAVAANILSGKKAHSKSNDSAVEITGTMPNNGSISASIDGINTMSYSIPSGYTSGGSISLTNDIENALTAI